MLRQRKRLSARGVATLSKPGRRRDGDGLCLAIDKAGRRRWTFMWRRDGKTHEIGLGSASVVTLAAARELAAEYRTYLAKGGGPLAARQSK